MDTTKFVSVLRIVSGRVILTLKRGVSETENTER